MSLTGRNRKLVATCLTKSLTALQKRCFAAPRKKFYEEVSVINNDNLYEICLDGKRIKSPQSRVVQVPSYQLALAIANEWRYQQETIKTHEMHLTHLTNIALDNPLGLTKKDLADQALEFLMSDTLCFRQTEPAELNQLQRSRWDPVIEWLKEKYKCEVPLSYDVVLPPIPTSTLATLHRHLLSYNDWSLFGIVSLAESLKSLILTLPLIDRHLPVEDAVSLSRLELEFQTQVWGNVEWAHTMELMMTQAKVASALLFVICNSESSSKVFKIKDDSFR